MLETVVLTAMIGLAIWLYWGKKKRELASLANLENLANGEYLNRSKAERFLSAKPGTYPTGAEYSSEYAVQETPAIYTTSIPLKTLNSINKINENFVEQRLAESKNLFDKLELTEPQRLAIARDEDANLINAGAGSGKTRTILGKVEYLVKQGLAKPAEILVVAYNKKIEQEIEQEIQKIAPGVTVSTFHALGLDIMKKVEGGKVHLSSLAKDDKKLGDFLSQKMRELLKIPQILHLLLNFFSAYRFEGDPEDGLKNKDEYFHKIRYIGMRSLDGKQLKSHQEVQIANWLLLNGIKWEYERDYPYNDSERQHQPDFYLPDYDLWIEHFGIDEHGNTAPWVEKEKYHEHIAWKRKTHEANQTRLVETYSYESKKEGGLPQALEEKLAQYGVQKTSISDLGVDHLVKENFKPTSNFIKLIKQFLSLSRENKFSEQKLAERMRSARDGAFLALFSLFRKGYEKKLKTDNEIDFTDMIVRGLEYVKKGKYKSRYKYILVDEYQDITKVRLDFLLALRKQVEDARLFCVGDDWQSIYQFQGANIDLITRFENYVGAMKRTDLDKTFRYSQKINDFSRIFITQNPAQLKKEINSNTPSKENARPIRIVYHDSAKQQELKKIIDVIASQSQKSENQCFVLGRYNHNKPANWSEITAYASSKNINIEFSTIHRAKGREANWVIVLENKSGLNGDGFPSETQDDPVLRMVRTEEDFSNAEERRLFYVAVTRARKGVFLLTPAGEASDFIQEIDPRTRERANHEPGRSVYEPFVYIEDSAASKILLCPECDGQTIRKTLNKEGGFFYACSHFPLCNGKLLTCENKSCDAAVDLKRFGRTDTYMCECGHESTICPECRRGILVQRDGAKGNFFGCSQFSVSGCHHTKNLPKNLPGKK